MNHLWRAPWNWWTTCWTARKRTACGRWSWTDCVAATGCCCCCFLCCSASRTWSLDPVRPACWPIRRSRAAWVADSPQQPPPASGSSPVASSVAPTWYLHIAGLVHHQSNRFRRNKKPKKNVGRFSFCFVFYYRNWCACTWCGPPGGWRNRKRAWKQEGNRMWWRAGRSNKTATTSSPGNKLGEMPRSRTCCV